MSTSRTCPWTALHLELGADDKPKRSLANVLRLHRPIAIVDEAHNARTSLSFNTLGNVMPSCILEFTATPGRAGNPQQRAPPRECG
ncbi:MAG: DEAD/DEAH box helicase family protein [Flavobacteriales bacterium]|nr:DEAD/DEAH box helicase family protein [Flavobacteriales bacterium]